MYTELIKKAKEAQKHSYSPYSNFSVGAALLCSDGEVFTGCNVEGASYGNAICAERTALVKAISEGKREFTAICIISSGEDYCMPCGICRQMLYEFSPNMIVLACKNNGEYRTFGLKRDLLPNAFSLF